MADRFDDWSVTANSNSTVDSISIAEGMAPAAVNNAMRAIMAAAALSFGGFPEGSARPSIVAAGSFWLDTTTAAAPVLKLYDGSDDITVITFDYSANTASVSGFNIVEDTTPQLGGNLDLNGNVITGLVIGTNVQAFDATLTSLAAVAGVSGDILYASGTDVWARLAKGSDGKILKLASGIPSWGLPLTRGTPIATTSGTSHTFTGIAAGANRITLMLDGVSLSGTDELLVQIGDSEGIETSSYISRASAGSTGSGVVTDGFIITVTLAASKLITGSCVFKRMDGNKWVENGMFERDAGATQRISSGVKTLSGELTELRLTRTGSDTFDAGSINIFTE